MRLSRAAFDALIQQDPEAVYALLRRLEEQVETLTRRVQALEEQRHATSRNSSRPPSSDPPGTPKRVRPASGRKPGGQPGHPGHTLEFVAPVDVVVAHPVGPCGRCGGPVDVQGEERRQVIEAVPRLIAVTEHRAARGWCAACGHWTVGSFPETVRAPVQYGPRLKAMGLYLLSYHLVPNARVSEVLSDLLGCELGVGTLQTALRQGAATLAPIETQIATALTTVPALHCDETGVSVAGHRAWLHVASSATLTHYGLDRRRGHTATDAIGILPRAIGRLVHDHWPAYWHYAQTAHGLCNAHHLRELTAVEERETAHAWASDLKTLLLAIKAHVAGQQAAGVTALSPTAHQRFVAQYTALLDAGDARHPPGVPTPGKTGRPKQTKTRNLLDRLRNHQAEVLAFMDDWRVPFDNNQAERDLRMVKVQQKIAGTFRTAAGAHAFCRWRGYLSTLKKQGRPLLDAIEQTLCGQPPLPSFAT